MGYAKNLMIEIEERGYGQNDNSVCEDCVGNYALNAYIKIEGEQGVCSYCGKDQICIPAELLLNKIFEGINFEYDLAINCLGVEKGQYIGTTYDKYDLMDNFQDELGLEDAVFCDVLDTINDDVWCKRNPYSYTESEAHLSLWEQFCNTIKRDIRYVFFRVPFRDEYGRECNIHIMDRIGDIARILGLIVTIEPGSSFFRARAHERTEKLVLPEDIASPPFIYAKDNRMSAKGISIFYGADSQDTALSEIMKNPCNCYTCCEFKNVNKLNLLDLSIIRDITIPSLFDSNGMSQREKILFFKEFGEYIMRPIETLTDVEYIPSQAIAEYFRYVYKYNGEDIHGIKYRSSVREEGICYALFFDNEECIETHKQRFSSKQQQLELNASSIETGMFYTKMKPRIADCLRKLILNLTAKATSG